MEIFVRSTRCRFPQQVLLHRRCFATALANKPQSSTRSKASSSSSADRPPRPTSQHEQSQPTPSKAKKSKQKNTTPPEDQTSADALKAINEVAAAESMAPFDVWARAVENMDLYIPAFKSAKKSASILDHIQTIWNTQKNWVKNVMNMYRIADHNSFPGVKVRRPTSLQLFRIQSTPWLQPFRREVLQTYQTIQRAVASGDEATIKSLSIGSQQKRLLELVRARDPNKIYVWNLSGSGSEQPSLSSCRVVSVRAFEQNLSPNPPKIGNRLLIQALVKFETTQTLDVFTKRGRHVQPAEPKRVVEYLVFQKRMWYNMPWVVRDQMYEGLGGGQLSRFL